MQVKMPLSSIKCEEFIKCEELRKARSQQFFRETGDPASCKRAQGKVTLSRSFYFVASVFPVRRQTHEGGAPAQIGPSGSIAPDTAPGPSEGARRAYRRGSPSAA